MTGGEVAPEVEPFLPVAVYCDPSVFDPCGADACFTHPERSDPGYAG